MEEKDWEARFELRRVKLRVFSWTALIIASLYGALITWLLVGVSRDSDSEAVTIGWLLFGLPWMLVVHGWFAVPLSALTLYVTVLAAQAFSKGAK